MTACLIGHGPFQISGCDAQGFDIASTTMDFNVCCKKQAQDCFFPNCTHMVELPAIGDSYDKIMEEFGVNYSPPSPNPCVQRCNLLVASITAVDGCFEATCGEVVCQEYLVTFQTRSVPGMKTRAPNPAFVDPPDPLIQPPIPQFIASCIQDPTTWCGVLSDVQTVLRPRQALSVEFMGYQTIEVNDGESPPAGGTPCPDRCGFDGAMSLIDNSCFKLPIGQCHYTMVNSVGESFSTPMQDTSRSLKFCVTIWEPCHATGINFEGMINDEPLCVVSQSRCFKLTANARTLRVISDSPKNVNIGCVTGFNDCIAGSMGNCDGTSPGCFAWAPVPQNRVTEHYQRKICFEWRECGFVTDVIDEGPNSCAGCNDNKLVGAEDDKKQPIDNILLDNGMALSSPLPSVAGKFNLLRYGMRTTPYSSPTGWVNLNARLSPYCWNIVTLSAPP
jgi:hypothetical protein